MNIFSILPDNQQWAPCDECCSACAIIIKKHPSIIVTFSGLPSNAGCYPTIFSHSEKIEYTGSWPNGAYLLSYDSALGLYRGTPGDTQTDTFYASPGCVGSIISSSTTPVGPYQASCEEGGGTVDTPIFGMDGVGLLPLNTLINVPGGGTAIITYP